MRRFNASNSTDVLRRFSVIVALEGTTNLSSVICLTVGVANTFVDNKDAVDGEKSGPIGSLDF